MTFNEQDIETLVTIGLTHTQATVYLTLASCGKAKAKTIWENSGVARQDIYRILTELQRKGLIEKGICEPAEFRAIPIQDALSILLKQKEHEYREIEEKTKGLLNRFRTHYLEKTAAKEYEFTMISTKEANIRRLNKEANGITKKSVDVIDSWDSFNFCTYVYSEQVEKGATRNVKFRYITEKPKKGEKASKIFQTWKKKGWAELRHIPTLPPTSIRIEDSKRVTLCLIPSVHSVEGPSLFSNNPCIVAVLQDYFELLWSKATEYGK
jgi:sugar-specific transcriptional regulator TrmB